VRGRIAIGGGQLVSYLFIYFVSIYLSFNTAEMFMKCVHCGVRRSYVFTVVRRSYAFTVVCFHMFDLRFLQPAKRKSSVDGGAPPAKKAAQQQATTREKESCRHTKVCVCANTYCIVMVLFVRGSSLRRGAEARMTGESRQRILQRWRSRKRRNAMAAERVTRSTGGCYHVISLVTNSGT